MLINLKQRSAKHCEGTTCGQASAIIFPQVASASRVYFHRSRAHRGCHSYHRSRARRGCISTSRELVEDFLSGTLTFRRNRVEDFLAESMRNFCRERVEGCLHERAQVQGCPSVSTSDGSDLGTVDVDNQRTDFARARHNLRVP